MFNDVIDVIRRCDMCQRIKVEHKKKGPMCKPRWPGKPLDYVSIDFFVDLPRTPRENQHILVINDNFSKFIRLYPLKID